MPDASRAGLKAAADSLARTMKRVAGVRTQRTADAVNVASEGDGLTVQGGHAGGPWGWDPIQGSMFDNNRRHPLFGDKHHWYHQGEYPITAITVDEGIDDAAEKYADAAVPIMLRQAGFE